MADSLNSDNLKASLYTEQKKKKKGILNLVLNYAFFI